MSNLTTPVRAPENCARCGSGRIFRELVRSGFTEGDRFVVVDGIPAWVCRDCGERAYDAPTSQVLEILRAEGFPADQAVDRIDVPVFRFGDRLAKSS